MPIDVLIERSPLCPPSPPPSLSRTTPNPRSRSSCTTTRSARCDVVVAQQPGDRAAGDVHVRPWVRRARRDGRRAGPPGRPRSPCASRTGRPRPALRAGRRRGRRRCAGSRRTRARGCRARPPGLDPARRLSPRRTVVAAPPRPRLAPSVSMDASTWAGRRRRDDVDDEVCRRPSAAWCRSGSGTSDAWIWVPTVGPATETSICSGMLETSASTSMRVQLLGDQGVQPRHRR